MDELSSSLKGAHVEADAIAFFTKLGYVVSIPFAPTGYDLVIERSGRFQRVQCKYAGRKHHNWGYIVHLTVWKKQRPVYHRNFDLLYCLTPDERRYIVPANCIAGHTVKLNDRFPAEVWVRAGASSDEPREPEEGAEGA